MIFPAQDLRSCHGCRHFDAGGYERETGYTAPPNCDAAGSLYENGECSEQVSIMFQTILFQLSALNNCPLQTRPIRKITDLK